MNLTKAKRTLLLALSALLMVGLVPATSFAAKPYFKSFGGDVFTGGWFKNGTNCDTAPASNYQDPVYRATDPRAELYGGIQAYAKTSGSNSAGGASVEFAAFALGLIDGARPEDGFYSSGARAPIDKKLLSFANSDAAIAAWGGLFQTLDWNSTIRQQHCITDYFGTKQNSPTVIPAGSVNLGSRGNGQFLVNNPGAITTINSSTVQIDRGRKVTVFVDGNAYIGGNIEYQNNIRIDQVTKFALVVRGSIYIDPAVTRLDGLYIAQPANNNSASVTADEGVIWSCHPNNNSQIFDDYPATQCGSRLVVNGAFIAKQINLLRTNGDLVGATPAEDAACGDAAAAKRFNGNGNGSINRECGNIAEVFNYPPEMVIGGPFFNPSPNASLRVQSLVSLPPVF